MSPKIDRSAARNGCALRDTAVKVVKGTNISKSLILKTTDTATAGTAAAANVGAAAAEVQATAEAAIHRSRPVEAVAAYVVERALVVVAVACRHKLQW